MPRKKNYAFKERALKIRGLDPQKVGEELSSIRRPTPEKVVRAARNKKSSMHDAFEWDDSEAAQKYRLEQARYLIQSVVVRVIDSDRTPQRAFVNVVPHNGDREENKKRVYISTEEALKDPDYRQQVLDTCLRDLQAFRDKYRDLRELVQVFRAADAVLKRHRAA